MCLGHSAHGVRSAHEIFNSPFKINIEYTDYPTPESYHHYLAGKDLGETIKVWKVQTTDGAENKELGWGVVNSPETFKNIPDAEVMSSGLNTKGPESVALGRHGNFFHWGFAAPPSMMTEELQKTFINAIHYISRFDGQAPSVRYICRDRSSVLNSILLLRDLKKVLGTATEEQYQAYLTKHVGRTFHPDLIEKYGNQPEDWEKYFNYFSENIEFLRNDGRYGGFVYIDEIAKGWGISNRDSRILDHAIKFLEEWPGNALEQTNAQKILIRYTNEHFASGMQWRKWFEKNKDKLFFTDAGGYKFLVNPLSP